MLYTVSASDLSSIRLNETNTASAVLQNIALILATKRGSVPLYREFGLSQEYLDKPILIAKPLVIVDVKESIALFEPRAEIVSITFDDSAEQSGKLVPIVEVNIP